MTIGTCNIDGCAGHLGKFPDCVTEALYILTLNGTDETTGTVDFQGHFTLARIAPNGPVVEIDGRTTPVTVPAGWYIVQEDSNGFVSVVEYDDNENEARAAFDAAGRAYAEWLGDDE